MPFSQYLFFLVSCAHYRRRSARGIRPEPAAQYSKRTHILQYAPLPGDCKPDFKARCCSPADATKEVQPVKLRPMVSRADYSCRRKSISAAAPRPTNAKVAGSGIGASVNPGNVADRGVAG